MRLMRQVRLSPTSPSPMLSVSYPESWQGEKSGSDEDTEFVLGKSYRLVTEDELDLAKEELVGGETALQLTALTLVDPEDPLLTYSKAELDELEKELNFEISGTSSSGGLVPEQSRVIQIRTKGYRGLGLRRLKDRVLPQLLYRSETSMNDFVGEEQKAEEQPQEASVEESPIENPPPTAEQDASGQEQQSEQTGGEEQQVEYSPPTAEQDASGQEQQPEEVGGSENQSVEYSPPTAEQDASGQEQQPEEVGDSENQSVECSPPDAVQDTSGEP